MSSEILFKSLLLITFSASFMSVQAAWPLDGNENLQLFGDIRGRFEADFDSQNANGEAREDRNRLRYRTRLGLKYQSDNHWLLQFRARTTREASQQSSALTIKDLSGGRRDDFRLLPDQWFVDYSRDKQQFWLGRNTYPFWQANKQEMIWADNATITGAYAGLQTSLSVAELGFRAGYFGLPDGMFDIGSRMAAMQTLLVLSPAENWELTIAGGLLIINGTDRSRFLIDGNGERNYRIGMLSAEFSRDLPANNAIAYIRTGVDLLHNFEHYADDDPNPVSPAFRDERSGMVVSLTTGGLLGNNGNRWELGYVYAYIEKLALNAAYAQADWIRWGSGGQTESSDLRGHGFSARYWFSKNLDVRARLYLADAIATSQDGNRFRLDLNYRF